MNSPNTAALSPELAEAFTPDRLEQGREAPYACRLLVARSAERKTVFAVFSGQIGLADVPVFKAALNDLMSDNPAKIIADFSRLSLTKSAAGALVGFMAFIHGLNRRLYLYRASAQIRTLLKDLKLTPFFSYLETEDDIIATLVV